MEYFKSKYNQETIDMVENLTTHQLKKIILNPLWRPAQYLNNNLVCVTSTVSDENITDLVRYELNRRNIDDV